MGVPEFIIGLVIIVAMAVIAYPPRASVRDSERRTFAVAVGCSPYLTNV